MADQPHRARRPQRIESPLGRQLSAVRDRLRFADHQRAGDDVAETAAQGVGHRGDRRDAVERRHEVDYAHDVADQRLMHRQRQSARIDDAQRQRALARRPPLTLHLEPDVPAPRQQESRRDRDRIAERARQQESAEAPDRHGDAGDDDEVDQHREKTAPRTRRLEADLDMFGRGDGQLAHVSSSLRANRYAISALNSRMATAIFNGYGNVFDVNCEKEPSINPAKTSVIAVAIMIRHTAGSTRRIDAPRVRSPGISRARPAMMPAAPPKMIDGNSSAPCGPTQAKKNIGTPSSTYIAATAPSSTPL